jgi:hypothetical protein
MLLNLLKYLYIPKMVNQKKWRLSLVNIIYITINTGNSVGNNFLARKRGKYNIHNKIRRIVLIYILMLIFKISDVFSEEEWFKIIDSNSTDNINYEKLINSLKNGINDRLRGKIWTLLSNSLKTALSHSEDLYYKLLNVEDIEIDSQINRDIERTILYSVDKAIIEMTSKYKKLFNILKAYSVYDGEVGYCQGSNYIVALLLCNINSERLCFWTLVQLMNDKNWREIYKNNTPKLLRMMEILKNNLKLKMPSLFEYFQQTGVNININILLVC